MRIALVVPGGVDRSGEERVIPAFVWLIERLARRHDVHVFALHQQPMPTRWELRGAEVENIGTTRFRRSRFLSRVAAAHRAAPFDIVHALFGGVGVLAALAAFRHRVPCVLHLAGGEPVALGHIGYGSKLTPRGRIGLRLAIAGAQRVTVATRYMQALVADMGVQSEVVPLGVALDHWPPRRVRARDTHTTTRLLHIGDLRPVKGQDTLLSAVARLVRDGCDVRLDIAGLDTMDGALQRTDAARALGDRVAFHGLLSRHRLRALAEQSDILVHASLHEAGPLCVLEAAIAGIPTVGTNVGQVSDWAPEAAVAVPVGDVSALARAIASLMSDEPRRVRIAAEAQARGMRVDADFTAAAFERIYTELVAARDQRRPYVHVAS
jgi:glycosyltransferase involved in cell wall biosynthesis